MSDEISRRAQDLYEQMMDERFGPKPEPQIVFVKWSPEMQSYTENYTWEGKLRDRPRRGQVRRGRHR